MLGRPGRGPPHHAPPPLPGALRRRPVPHGSRLAAGRSHGNLGFQLQVDSELQKLLSGVRAPCLCTARAKPTGSPPGKLGPRQPPTAPCVPHFSSPLKARLQGGEWRSPEGRPPPVPAAFQPQGGHWRCRDKLGKPWPLGSSRPAHVCTHMCHVRTCIYRPQACVRGPGGSRVGTEVRGGWGCPLPEAPGLH